MNSLTRNRDFLKLWIGQGVSELGSRITREGIPYTALLVLGVQPPQMGVLSAVGAASVLIFGSSAGVWVDRLNRRSILIAADLGRALLLSTIPLAAAWHVLSMTQLFVITALTGILTVFFDVAWQSYLPSIVERYQIFEGNTKLMVTATAAEIAGPGITGVLVQVITAPLAILFDAASFLFSAMMIMSIGRREAAHPPATTEQQIWRESIAGFHFIAADPILRALALRSAGSYFFGGFYMPLYIIYSIDTLHLTPALLGIIIATGGVGGILGSAAASRITRRLGLGRSFLIMAVIQGLATALMPLAHGTPVQAMFYMMGAQLFGDSAATVYIINETSLRQTVVPHELLGRVNAAIQLASRGVLPLGALAGGFLAGAYGIRPVLSLATAGVIASILVLTGSRIRSVQQDDITRVA